MWNLYHSNRLCNTYDKIKDHNMHIERVLTAKSTLDRNGPAKPSFLVYKAKKEQMDEERKDKIGYENNLLIKKIIRIETKASPYNPVNLQVKICPAFDNKVYYQQKSRFEIDKENLKLYKRLASAKPHYKTDQVIKDYLNSKYLENLICENKNSVNPNINLKTPETYKKFISNEASKVAQNSNMRPNSAPRFMSEMKLSSNSKQFNSKKTVSAVNKNPDEMNLYGVNYQESNLNKMIQNINTDNDEQI